MAVPTPLPPGVVAERHVYANGEETTIYRAPFEVTGPVRFVDERERQVLAFLYASFVFVWPASSATVDISHGELRGKNLVLYRGVPIVGPWTEDTLARFGTAWARSRMARFRTP